MLNRRTAIALLLVALGAAIAIVVAVSSGGGGESNIKDIRFAEPGRDVMVQADKDQQFEPNESHEAAAGTTAKRVPPGPTSVAPPSIVATPDVHEDTRDETPPGVPEKEIAAGKRETEKKARGQLVAPRRDVGGAQSVSCPNAPVANQSALTSRRVGVALHFTVSASGTLLAIRGLFNTPSFGASSNYGIELFGRCQHWVPDNRKAWAQLTANSAYVSIEIVTFDLTRQQWLNSPIIRDGTLAALVREISIRQGTPLRLVDPNGCVFDAGITDHNRLECGNNHTDVGRNFPWDVFIPQVQRGVTVVPKKAIRLCTELNGIRAHQKKGKLTRRERLRKDRLDYYFAQNHDRGNVSYGCGAKGARVNAPHSSLPAPVQAKRLCREYNKFRKRAMAGGHLGSYAETRLENFLRPYFDADRRHEHGKAVYRCSFEKGAIRRPVRRSS